MEWHIVIKSLMSRVFFSASQFIATLFVVVRFTTEQQGVYFTFLAILSIQFIFELGLSQVVVTSISRIQSVTGNLGTISPATVGIIRSSFKQYGRFAVLFFCVSTLAGVAFMWPKSTSTVTVWHLMIPWIFSTCAYSARFLIIWIEAIEEGNGGIARIILVRSIAQIIWILTFIGSTFFDNPLFAVPAATLTSVLVSLLLYRDATEQIYNAAFAGQPSPTDRQWRNDVRQFQGRMSMTWIASYCISNLPVPIMYAFGSPAFAGRLGVALQFGAVIGVVSASLSVPRIAKATAYLSTGQQSHFLSLFRATLFTTGLASLGVAVIAILSVYLIGYVFSSQVSQKIPSVVEITPFIIASLTYSYMAIIALFYRSKQEEVFTTALTIVAFSSVITAIILAKSVNLFNIGLAFMLPVLLIILPISVYYHRKLYQSVRGCLTGKHS